jgi:lipopolysaccharide biosynthesis glycosyltransferase
MVTRTAKAANKLYLLGDYYGALNIYHELASEIGHNIFTANIALCLDKLSAGGVNVISDCINLAGKQKFDVLSEFFSKDIVVSLTSYPARIDAVPETLKSILAQSFKPWKLVLWLAREQFPGLERDLPPELVRLKDKGLSIEWCEDIRSYKKLIPSLRTYPDKIIVTADDDIIYGKNWLAQLVIAHICEPDAIVCHRAHQVLLNENGNFSPYKLWLKEIKGENSSLRHLFTGCGGVLYPPGSLHEAVQDRNAFSSTCPNGDDLWFWGMAVLNGSKIQTVKDSSFKLDFVPGTQATALWIGNCQDGGNDSMLRALSARFPEIVQRLKESEKPKAGVVPKVSIITPIFNTGKYLADCLDSIINQHFQDFEVLCIDDGTTDDITKDILTKYSRKDPRIRVIRQQNSGPATSRNNGLKKANGLYIAFVDSDDYISANYIGNLYECAQLHGVDIAVADKILCVDGSKSQEEKRSGFERYQKVDAKRIAAHAIVTTGVTWNKLYKKEFLLNNGIEYLDGMRCQSEDNYFSIMAIALGHKSIALAKDVTYFYRQHEGGITKNITMESFGQSMLVYETVQRRLVQLDIQDKQYWLNVANQRAFKDLKHIAKGLSGKASAESLLDKKFTTSIDLCCIADEKYVIPTLVFLESVKRTKFSTTHPSITVLVPTGSMREMEILEKMSSPDFLVKVLEVDATQFDGLHKYKKEENYCMASPSAMFKFIIPNVFSYLDRILYIDTDLIVRNDLLELFMTSMEDEYLCAVPDLWQPVTDRTDIKRFRSYFNSGVMLMNLSRMRIENLPAKLIEAKLNSTNFNLMDQDIFNEVCTEHFKILDIKYNFLPVCYKRHKHKFDLSAINRLYGSTYTKIEEIAADPVVAHWAGSDKPWISKSTLFSDEWVNMFETLKLKGFVSDQCGLALQM